MNNNYILRRIRYAFDYSDEQMIKMFRWADVDVSRAEVSDWLKSDDDPAQKPLYDRELAVFLNGMINKYRGKREGEQPKPEKSLNNNTIFRKLKIALNLKDTDILDIYALAKFDVGKHELSAIFRKPTQSQYRVCKDQFLRNFLLGLQMKHRKQEPDNG
ncbi:MAG: DUF1456 family protein [Cyclobacteriaceae bacterium]